MHDYFLEMWSGPGHLRFFLQPALALVLAIVHGLRDARAGRPPYGLVLAHGPGSAGSRLLALLKTLALPLGLAVLGSTVFQLIIRGTFHPGAAVLYAVIFVAFPYVLARGVTNRISRGVRRPVRA